MERGEKTQRTCRTRGRMLVKKHVRTRGRTRGRMSVRTRLRTRVRMRAKTRGRMSVRTRERVSVRTCGRTRGRMRGIFVMLALAALMFASAALADEPEKFSPMKIILTDKCGTIVQYPVFGVPSLDALVQNKVLPYLESLVRARDEELAPVEGDGAHYRSVEYNLRGDNPVTLIFTEQLMKSGGEPYSFGHLYTFIIDISDIENVVLAEKLPDEQQAVDPFTSWTQRNWQTAREKDKKYIALTFDDGPSIYTTSILAILRAYGVKATFCVIGNRVGVNQSIVEQAAWQGCEVVGHSWDHSDLTKMTDLSVKSQLGRTNEIIESLTGVPCKLFRPPYGSTNKMVKEIAAQMDMSVLLWSVDTEDWKDRDADRIYSHIMANAKDGAIILCHDIYKATRDAVRRAVPDLIDKGYELVTVSELIWLLNETAPAAGVTYITGYE